METEGIERQVKAQLYIRNHVDPITRLLRLENERTLHIPLY